MYGSEECKSSNKEKSDSDLSPCECAMPDEFEICNVHTVCAEKERGPVLSTKIYYVEHNRKTLLAKGVQLNSTD